MQIENINSNTVRQEIKEFHRLNYVMQLSFSWGFQSISPNLPFIIHRRDYQVKLLPWIWTKIYALNRFYGNRGNLVDLEDLQPKMCNINMSNKYFHKKRWLHFAHKIRRTLNRLTTTTFCYYHLLIIAWDIQIKLLSQDQKFCLLLLFFWSN